MKSLPIMWNLRIGSSDFTKIDSVAEVEKSQSSL
jgi:hypothetical protein